MVLAIRFWFKVDYSFTIISDHGLVYYLILKQWSLALYNTPHIIHVKTSVSRRSIYYV